MTRFFCLLGLAMTLVLGAHSAMADQPRVLVSIKPIELIFAAIGGDELELQRLLEPAASPHNYQLKPSDVRKILEADAVVWVGPELETFLAQVIHNTAPKRPIALTQQPALAQLQGLAQSQGKTPTDESKLAGQGDHDAISRSEGHSHDHHHDHDHASGDSHIWLSPELASAVAGEAVALFSELLPQQSALFQQRFKAFQSALKQADARNRALLNPLRSRGFLVTHDGYSHFVQHYGLKQVDALALSPDRQPGARHIAQLRQRLLDSQAHCVLAEPQIRPSYLPVLIDGLKIQVEEIDPMGTNIDVTERGYVMFLEDLAQDIARCLRP